MARFYHRQLHTVFFVGRVLRSILAPRIGEHAIPVRDGRRQHTYDHQHRYRRDEAAYLPEAEHIIKRPDPQEQRNADARGQHAHRRHAPYRLEHLRILLRMGVRRAPRDDAEDKGQPGDEEPYALIAIVAVASSQLASSKCSDMPSIRITSVERATPWIMLVNVRYAGANCPRSRAATDDGLWWSWSRISQPLLIVGAYDSALLECPHMSHLKRTHPTA